MSETAALREPEFRSNRRDDRSHSSGRLRYKSVTTQRTEDRFLRAEGLGEKVEAGSESLHNGVFAAATLQHQKKKKKVAARSCLREEEEL